MPHYMLQARYSTEAIKAMTDEPQDREAAATALIERFGGRLLSFHFCFGADDVVALAELPDDATMAAVSMTIGASGGFSSARTTKLFSAGEAKRAMEAARSVASKYESPTG